jgi:hypothetical protein
MTRAVVDLDPDHPDRIAVWSDYRHKDAVKRVPGAKWDADNRRWHVPLSWPACLALRAELGEQLEIKPDLRAWAAYTRDCKDKLRSIRGLVEPEGDATWVDRARERPGFADLYSHQLVDAQCIALAGSYLLTNETGVGKSRGALAGLSLLHNDVQTVFPLMIIAPK